MGGDEEAFVEEGGGEVDAVVEGAGVREARDDGRPRDVGTEQGLDGGSVVELELETGDVVLAVGRRVGEGVVQQDLVLAVVVEDEARDAPADRPQRRLRRDHLLLLLLLLPLRRRRRLAVREEAEGDVVGGGVEGVEAGIDDRVKLGAQRVAEAAAAPLLCAAAALQVRIVRRGRHLRNGLAVFIVVVVVVFLYCCVVVVLRCFCFDVVVLVLVLESEEVEVVARQRLPEGEVSGLAGREASPEVLFQEVRPGREPVRRERQVQGRFVGSLGLMHEAARQIQQVAFPELDRRPHPARHVREVG
mmetsp:Transcript_16877/g.51170  ORF Transcript_16877/g.51170 Transcript_16877/m.51170 type:complete len:303 (-) Transcript_16877:920-1828(-)